MSKEIKNLFGEDINKAAEELEAGEKQEAKEKHKASSKRGEEALGINGTSILKN